MSFLARKITLSKWNKIDGNISADAITSCLKTTKNSMSLWVVEDENDDLIKEVVLAMGSNGERADKMDLVLLKEDFFATHGIQVDVVDGESKVLDINNKHRDIVNLNLPKLTFLSSEIQQQIEDLRQLSPEQLESYFLVKSFSKGEVVDIIKTALDAGRMNIADLSEGIQKQISKLEEKKKK